MSEFVTCASCGARNASEAVWCSMCFEPLRVPEPAAPTDEVPSLEPESDSVTATVEGARPAEVSDVGEVPMQPPVSAHESAAAPTWTCRTCETVNPISTNECAVCGATIFETMGAPTDEIALSRDEGLRLGLLPGLAHVRLGEPVLGFMVGILVLACVVFATVFIQSGGALWGSIVGLVGLLTWVVSIVDVHQRIAGAAPILRPRVMTILGAVVIVVIMVAGFVAGATAVRSPGS